VVKKKLTRSFGWSENEAIGEEYRTKDSDNKLIEKVS